MTPIAAAAAIALFASSTWVYGDGSARGAPAAGAKAGREAAAEIAALLARTDARDSARLLQIGRMAWQRSLKDAALEAADRAIAAGADAAKTEELLLPIAQREIEGVGGAALSLRAQQLFSGVAKLKESPARLLLTKLTIRQMPAAARRTELEHAIAAPSPEARRLAAELWQTLEKNAKTAPLVRRIYVDKDPEVRRAAARSLSAAGDPKVTKGLSSAMYAMSPLARIHSAEALGEIGGIEAAASLIKKLGALAQGGGGAYVPRAYFYSGNQIAYVSGYNVEVAQASAIAEPEVSTLMDGVVLDVGILSTTIERHITIEKTVVRNALVKIAGKDLGADPAAWAQWLKAKSAPASGVETPSAALK